MPLASSKLAAGERRARPELADIFRRYGECFEQTHRVSAAEHKVIRAVTVCRTQELGGYLDLVFTLPHEFNRLILAHKKILLALVFKAVSETLLEFGQRRFKGTVGIIAVLHTWDQTLQDHFHLHCLVPAGALSLDH